jgi:hypothetical protein
MPVRGAEPDAGAITENIVVFDAENRLVEGATIDYVFQQHYKVRHAVYEKRLATQRAAKLREATIAVGSFLFVKLLNTQAIDVKTLTDEKQLEAILAEKKVPRVDDAVRGDRNRRAQHCVRACSARR